MRPATPVDPGPAASPPLRSYVVTGGGRGVGRAIVERLLAGGDAVVVLELDRDALGWLDGHPSGERVAGVTGSAADPEAADRAAGRAVALAPLTGWVNNAAVFRDASMDSASAREIVDLVTANLAPAVVGCAVAVRRFLAAGSGGSIVNVSSHQAQRVVRGALPYATAKAAIEGLLLVVVRRHEGRHDSAMMREPGARPGRTAMSRRTLLAKGVRDLFRLLGAPMKGTCSWLLARRRRARRRRARPRGAGPGGARRGRTPPPTASPRRSAPR